MAQQIQTVAVIGCGVIGMSWVSLFLSRGLKVIASDPVEGAEAACRRYVHDAWPSISKDKDLEQTLSGNFEFVPDVTARLQEVDFIQEASPNNANTCSVLRSQYECANSTLQNGPERIEFKEELMQVLDRNARPGVVIASSSSGLPSSKFIGRCQNDPSRILIGHPFNPPHLIPLVEVVPHAGTNPQSASTALEFYKALGKRPILIRHEFPGFVANRLQAAINNEAYSLISRGIVSAEDLDAAITSGPGLRWALSGPIVTNALGGGQGSSGFNSRIERLGPAIRGWEEDIREHRFDWSDEKVVLLKEEAAKWLEKVKWSELVEQRDTVLLDLLSAKAKAPSIV
ncbi:hypothetical protein E8E13_001556 [Curvularia kusanoi]|uniref:3-hydroxyacyl-CoA dehydrogenase n=1 Tax=Curvularia kusanoi TaxID=90978 RepID=A0A9P4W282_CURKU|nr:hypothetical protein E8E13_001556 [Curvularia kusanoi]